MSAPLCQVVGCGQEAAYIRALEGNGLLEDYLCTACFQIMKGWYSSRSDCYILLKDRPARHAEELSMSGEEALSRTAALKA